MSVSSFTICCTKSSYQLTRAQVIEIELALAAHVDQLTENHAFGPTKERQLVLLAANNALDTIRRVLK